MFIFLTLLGCAEVVEQSAACEQYVSCLDARDAELGLQTNTLRFEPNGACWGGAEGAALCDRACDNGLQWLQEADPDLPELCS